MEQARYSFIQIFVDCVQWKKSIFWIFTLSYLIVRGICACSSVINVLCDLRPVQTGSNSTESVLIQVILVIFSGAAVASSHDQCVLTFIFQRFLSDVIRIFFL